MIYDVVEENLNTNLISVIGGGTFAKDMVYKVPIGLTVASHSKIAKETTLKDLECDYV